MIDAVDDRTELRERLPHPDERQLVAVPLQRYRRRTDAEPEDEPVPVRADHAFAR